MMKKRKKQNRGDKMIKGKWKTALLNEKKLNEKDMHPLQRIFPSRRPVE
jgi:hypothetical protein